jgi:tRNA nucleotidyltransferase (CCA-adding enzyme)
MEVITTHLNADFDAFASMVAAKKLYPDAVVAFPGSQEKNLRDFFMESTMYILSIERAKDIDLAAVKRLILVDTRQKSRIGRFSSLEESPDVEIHVYDHHPDSDDDVKGDVEVIESVGANVTLLIREIRKRGINLTAEEVTILALGIYEDTGSFTFSSTTSEDLEAAAWLLDQGVNLNTISNMMTSELNREQVEILHQLIEGSETLSLGGVEIRLSSASVEGYVGDLAVLVHKFRDMETLDAVFVLVRMEDRVHLISRSRVEAVNVGDIAAEFGGGGHPTAASATIRDMSLYEAREKLASLLREKVHPKRHAGEIMSRPVITIRPDRSLADAAETLSRYEISSLPVVENGSILGILHRNAVEKASHHGFATASVRDYMTPGAVSVDPKEFIERVLDVAVEGGQRLVCVVDGEELIGVISRSDLLAHLRLPAAKDAAADDFPVGRMRSKSVRRLMDERFPQKVLDILTLCGEVAAGRNEEVYLVGGAVRDLLLRNLNLDIDLVVEGDGILFARDLAKEFPGSRVRDHAKFGTAVILFEDGFKIDVATARHEYYDSPGALPTVETSSIKRDLYRRDFTMNTLAVSLNPRTMGQVIDFFGGSRDIKDRAIRVLHNLAFVEDPTRIMRAIRFSSRFGFGIGKHTRKLMKSAIRLKIFDTVEGKRLLNELVHMLDEKNPLAPLSLMQEFGVPEAIHPALRFDRAAVELAEGVKSVLSWWQYLFTQEKAQTWLVYFFGLTDSADDREFRQVMDRFSIVQSLGHKLLRERSLSREALSNFARGRAETPSKVAVNLRSLTIEALLYMMARTTRDRTRKSIAEYINELRHVKTYLNGDDLIALGYRPGPVFGKIFETLLDARLDGRIHTRDHELAMVENLFPLSDQEEKTASN